MCTHTHKETHVQNRERNRKREGWEVFAAIGLIADGGGGHRGTMARQSAHREDRAIGARWRGCVLSERWR